MEQSYCLFSILIYNTIIQWHLLGNKEDIPMAFWAIPLASLSNRPVKNKQNASLFISTNQINSLQVLRDLKIVLSLLISRSEQLCRRYSYLSNVLSVDPAHDAPRSGCTVTVMISQVIPFLKSSRDPKFILNTFCLT